MTRAWPLLGLPLLAGCPYLLGPPELVPTGSATGAATGVATGAATGTATGGTATGSTGVPTGTATGAATGTATGTPGGVATGSPGGTPSGTLPPDPTPRLDSASVRFGFGEALIELGVEDPNGDLVGGIVVISGDAATLLAIPSDLASFTPPGDLTVSLPVGLPCGGLDQTYTVLVTDAAGNASLPVDLRLVVSGVSHAPDNDPLDVGTIALPAIVCGDLSNANDVDLLAFQASPAGTWTFALTDLDTPQKDRDLELLDAVGGVLASAVTANDPDVLQGGLLGGQTYQLQVSTQEVGAGSAWTIAVYP